MNYYSNKTSKAAGSHYGISVWINSNKATAVANYSSSYQCWVDWTVEQHFLKIIWSPLGPLPKFAGGHNSDLIWGIFLEMFLLLLHNIFSQALCGTVYCLFVCVQFPAFFTSHFRQLACDFCWCIFCYHGCARTFLNILFDPVFHFWKCLDFFF